MIEACFHCSGMIASKLANEQLDRHQTEPTQVSHLSSTLSRLACCCMSGMTVLRTSCDVREAYFRCAIEDTSLFACLLSLDSIPKVLSSTAKTCAAPLDDCKPAIGPDVISAQQGLACHQVKSGQLS